MSKTVAIVATLDTKEAEARFVEHIIRDRAHRTLMIDIGVLGDPALQADVTNADVAREGGIELGQLRADCDKASAMQVMTRGAAVMASKLYAKQHFDAMVGIGGSSGTAIAASAMRALPLGVPKVLVSTVASGDTRPYLGSKDIALLHSVADIAGLNRITRRVLANAAGAVIGMVETEPPTGQERPLVVASMFGNTTPCVTRAGAILERAGFEVLVFHATGTGGMTMETFIADGYVDGVLDITTTEWADELCGGIFSAGTARLDAAALTGTPQVVVPGCLDMVNFGAPDTVPAQYSGRHLFCWNPNVTLMRTTVAENLQLGKILANKLNRSSGPIAVLLPLGGVGSATNFALFLSGGSDPVSSLICKT